jgi:HSP20 family protein
MSEKHRYLIFPQRCTEVVWRPAVDIYRTRSGWVLKFDLAGVDLRDISVEVQGCRVSIAGIRRDWLLEEGCTYYCMEINYNAFERTVELPCDVDAARWEIDFNNGMLLVRLTTSGDENERKR